MQNYLPIDNSVSDEVILILEKIEQAEGRLAKIDILKKNADNNLLKAVFSAACDLERVFHISKIKFKQNINVHCNSLLEIFVLQILPKLEQKLITGNEARSELENFFAVISNLDQKWCKKILLKKLNIGIQASTIHDVWPDLIETFEVQLAEKIEMKRAADGSVSFNLDIKYPIRLEPKLDGLRLIALKENGAVKLYTRNGSELKTLPGIQAAIEYCSEDNFMLDGEAFAQNWNDSVSVAFSSKNNKSDINMEYHVFDAMSIQDWQCKNSSMTLRERVDRVKQIVNSIKHEKIIQVFGVEAKDSKDISDFYLRCVAEKFEGIMIKKIDTTYEFDRTENILKLKPVQTVEGVITGWFTGKPGTKRESLFNGFSVTLENGVSSDCGSGLNDKIRAEIQLAGPDTYIGKIIECECAQIPTTSDGLTELGKMLFPVFKRFRDNRDVSKKLIAISKSVSLGLHEKDDGAR